MSAVTSWENKVLPYVALPNRILSYTKIVKGERSDKLGKQSFTIRGIAEPHPILYKDNANERKESLLSFSRMQVILYKDTEK